MEQNSHSRCLIVIQEVTADNGCLKNTNVLLLLRRQLELLTEQVGWITGSETG